jgi:hypothetical protein
VLFEQLGDGHISPKILARYTSLASLSVFNGRVEIRQNALLKDQDLRIAL